MFCITQVSEVKKAREGRKGVRWNGNLFAASQAAATRATDGSICHNSWPTGYHFCQGIANYFQNV